MKRMHMLGAVLAFATFAVRSGAETDPRDYAALAPAKSNSLVTLGYARAVSSSDSQNLSQTVGILRAVYVLRFGNLALVPFDAFLPMVDVTVYAAPTAPFFHGSGITDHVSGLADLTYLPTIAYVVPEGEGTSTTVAASGYLTMPTGMYDSSKVINIGKNRWSIQPQLALVQRISTVFTMEAVGYAVFYTDNTAFQPPAMLPLQTLKQELTWGADVHVAYNPTLTGFVAVSYYLAANGKTFFDPTVNGRTVGAEQTAPDQQTIHTLRFSYGWRVEKESLILFQFNQDVAASGGGTIGRFVGARVSHTFEL